MAGTGQRLEADRSTMAKRAATEPQPNQQLFFAPRTFDLKEFEELGRAAKDVGFTHLFISQLSERTDCRGDENSDSFSWAPTIRLAAKSSGSRPTADREWSARDDFSGPKELPKPLQPLERYAQVLLVSDELFFID